jgi:hypothetical protein
MLAAMLLAWSDAVTTGVFALVGVVIGALVAGIVQAYFELRGERSDERQAKRIVTGELMQNYLRLTTMVDSGRAPSRDFQPMVVSDSAWREYGPTLARHMDGDAFAAVQAFMETLPTLRDILAAFGAGEELPTELREGLENSRSQGIASYQILTGKDDLEELAHP